ncbi:MAG TPA: hypothetical protein VK454_02475 [Myxococcaceae bacterium]|nr:hypothetical protein [Myxococcaceae bacterium]
MRKLLVIPAAVALLAQGARAQGTPPAGSPPASQQPVEVKSTGTPGQAAAVRTQKVTAKVTAIDQANRTVTLQVPGGKPQTFSVGPEVKRLNEVAVGDSVVIEYQEGLMLEYQPAGTADVAPTAVVAKERAGQDQAPGGAAGAGVQATVTVTAIDTKNRIVVFQGPAGNIYQVKAGPKIHLEKLKVGDKLLATYVQAVAISLEKAAKK